MRPTPASKAAGELVVGLVVAVEDQTGRGHAGRQGDVELASGRDVQPHAFFVDEPGHGQAEKRLGGIGDPVAPRRHGLATARPEVFLVVDEQWGPEPLGQLEELDTADRQASLGAHPGRHGEQLDAHRALVGAQVRAQVANSARRRDRPGRPWGKATQATLELEPAAERERPYIESGALTPSMSRPMARPTRAASTSHRRAWVRSSATVSASTGQSW